MVKHYISTDLLSMELRQMGASTVQITSSKLIFVQFDISDTLHISYFCNIRDEGKIYIQRIEPYPIRNYGFENVDNILKFIKDDVKLFINASKSSNFSLFLDIINTNYFVRKELEQLFLMNNVPHGLLEDLLEDDLKMLQKIKNAEHNSLSDVSNSLTKEYENILDDATVIIEDSGIDGVSSKNATLKVFEEIVKQNK